MVLKSTPLVDPLIYLIKKERIDSRPQDSDEDTAESDVNVEVIHQEVVENRMQVCEFCKAEVPFSEHRAHEYTVHRRQYYKKMARNREKWRRLGLKFQTGRVRLAKKIGASTSASGKLPVKYSLTDTSETSASEAQPSCSKAQVSSNNPGYSFINNTLEMRRAGVKKKYLNKPKGRINLTSYAYFVQTCREEHKRKHPDESVTFAEFDKKCAQRWKIMSEKEKKRFQDMANRDKKRSDNEMQDYTTPKGAEAKDDIIGGKRRKVEKDPNATKLPKRFMSSFLFFCNDERTRVKAANPEYGVGDMAKVLGKMWADASPDLKRNYQAMAERDKDRYNREIAAYKERGAAAADDDE